MDHIPQNTEFKLITLIPSGNFHADSLYRTQVTNEHYVPATCASLSLRVRMQSRGWGYCVVKLSSLDRKPFCSFAGVSKITNELQQQTNYPSIPYPFPVLANARHFRQRWYFPRGRQQLQFTCLVLLIGNQIIIVLRFILCPSN